MPRHSFIPICCLTLSLSGIIHDAFADNNASNPASSPELATIKPDYSLTLHTGYRTDELFWNKGQVSTAINGTTYNPNILSELTWDSLETWYTRLGLEGIHQNYLVRMHVGYGTSYSGDNQDSDYFFDNRQGEFSRSNNNADDSVFLDWSFGLGYAYPLNERLQIKGLGGYAWNKQDLKITDGFQTIDTINGNTGSFSGLDSSYEAIWKGLWLGAEAEYAIQDQWSARLGYEYHIVDYDAEGYWNLRTDWSSPSFEHDSDGTGHVFSLNVDYRLHEQWTASLLYHLSYFVADEGTEVINFANGSTASTVLNEAEWDSSQLLIGAKYKF